MDGKEPGSDPEAWQALLDQLAAEFQRREEELALLGTIDRAILDERSVVQLLHETVTRLARSPHIARASVWVSHQARWDVLHSAGKSPNTHGESEDLLGSALQSSPVLLDQIDSERPAVIVDGVRIEVGLGTRRLVALLAVEYERSYAPNGRDSRFIGSLARQLSVALDVASALPRKLVHDTARAVLNTALPGLELSSREFGAIAEVLLSFLPEGTQLQILFPFEDEMEIAYSTDEFHIGLSVTIADSISGSAWSKNEPIVIEDLDATPRGEGQENEPRVSKYKSFFEGMRSEVAIPVGLGGSAHAVVNAEGPTPGFFSSLDVHLITRSVDQLAPIISAAATQALFSAYFDRASAKSTFQSLGRQAGHVIHRVNGRLGGLRFDLKDLRDRLGESDEDEVSELIQQMLETVEEALSIVDEMERDVSEYDVIDPNETLRALSEGLAVDQTVGIDIDGLRATRRIRGFMLDEILENVLANARRAVLAAVANDGIERSIHLSTIDRDLDDALRPFVDIIVRDEGIGMDPGARRMALQLGERPKPEMGEQRSGMGMGLWLAKQSVSEAGGSLDIESEPGKGTVVTIALPAVESA